MAKRDWIQIKSHAGHFICSERCNFFRNTYVNGYIVSTVGGMLKDSPSHPQDYEDIGRDRKYETMVFTAKISEMACCPFQMADAQELEMEPYNNEYDAIVGHTNMCYKYDSLPA